MKTLAPGKAYGWMVTVAITAAVFGAVVLAALFDWGFARGSHSVFAGGGISPASITGGILGFVVGGLLGITAGMFLLQVTDPKVRENVRHTVAPVATLPLGNVLPASVVGGDAFEPVRRQLQADKEAEDAEVAAETSKAPGAPVEGASAKAKLADGKCSACGKTLDSEEQLKFCYHCGAELAS